VDRDEFSPKIAGPAGAGDAIQAGQPILVARNAGLEVRNIGKTYKKRPVIRDVSLQVQRGDAVGLLGPNGAGKTTSFYIITGLITPDYGDIALDGEVITNLPMYRRARLGIGYLPQEASIFRGLTVEQNLNAMTARVGARRTACRVFDYPFASHAGNCTVWRRTPTC
jgi:lipopolysaccharide export system ATP-binding protein